MKIYQAVQKLLVGQTGDLISLLSFLESRLKNTMFFSTHPSKLCFVQTGHFFMYWDLCDFYHGMINLVKHL
jgi:hypothetical protein